MRKCDSVAHIVEHEHDKCIEYSVDPTADFAKEYPYWDMDHPEYVYDQQTGTTPPVDPPR